MPPSSSLKKGRNLRTWEFGDQRPACTPSQFQNFVGGKYMESICVVWEGGEYCRLDRLDLLKGEERKHAEKHTCRRCGRKISYPCFLYELRYCWSAHVYMFVAPTPDHVYPINSILTRFVCLLCSHSTYKHSCARGRRPTVDSLFFKIVTFDNSTRHQKTRQNECGNRIMEASPFFMLFFLERPSRSFKVTNWGLDYYSHLLLFSGRAFYWIRIVCVVLRSLSQKLCSGGFVFLGVWQPDSGLIGRVVFSFWGRYPAGMAGRYLLAHKTHWSKRCPSKYKRQFNSWGGIGWCNLCKIHKPVLFFAIAFTRKNRGVCLTIKVS